MFELLEKMMLTGVGAMSMTQKKAEEMLGEMKERFNVSEEEGKAFLEKMRKNAEDTQKKLEEMAQEEIRRAAERVGVVTMDEFEKLQKKVQLLDRHVKELEKQAKEAQR
ncbi:phasin family protein [Geoalkalibacter halelectricus]|uniref:Phasin family protein n=1 Tax=Geoalkalibacter halelectricus TaxID=2847045 RepID=A0ABY5ZSN1_9BACT|nr:phasin family protein [Geoalkalibacter halelectricus]MDO3379204.1 phasin family protein [Geoalkalibacter halelectricus]UWZ80962.1 phasin family protein [Geoalkalibacter halelectricus]